MQLRTEVDIAAPPQLVWDTLTDFPRYEEWNPFIVAISGKLAVGASLSVTFAPPDSREMTFSPQVLKVEAARELRWRGVLWHRSIFCGEHFFLLKELEGVRTRVTHGEDFSGLLMKVWSPTKTARGFVFMNQALKRRVEVR